MAKACRFPQALWPATASSRNGRFDGVYKRTMGSGQLAEPGWDEEDAPARSFFNRRVMAKYTKEGEQAMRGQDNSKHGSNSDVGLLSLRDDDE